MRGGDPPDPPFASGGLAGAEPSPSSERSAREQKEGGGVRGGDPPDPPFASGGLAGAEPPAAWPGALLAQAAQHRRKKVASRS